jgi:hypothetical protein
VRFSELMLDRFSLKTDGWPSADRYLLKVSGWLIGDRIALKVAGEMNVASRLLERARTLQTEEETSVEGAGPVCVRC